METHREKTAVLRGREAEAGVSSHSPGKAWAPRGGEKGSFPGACRGSRSHRPPGVRLLDPLAVRAHLPCV